MSNEPYDSDDSSNRSPRESRQAALSSRPSQPVSQVLAPEHVDDTIPLLALAVGEWFARPDFQRWHRYAAQHLGLATWSRVGLTRDTDYADIFMTFDGVQRLADGRIVFEGSDVQVPAAMGAAEAVDAAGDAPSNDTDDIVRPDLPDDCYQMIGHELYRRGWHYGLIWLRSE